MIKSELEDIKVSLYHPITKKHAEAISQLIIDKPFLLKAMIHFSFQVPPPASTRAAWIIDACNETNKNKTKPFLPEIIQHLPEANHGGVRRSYLRILSKHFMSIHEEYTGELIDLCFTWLASPIQPVAVKVHCMQILYNFCMQEPLLKNELIFLIKDQLPKNSVGFRARGRKLLTLLNQL